MTDVKVGVSMPVYNCPGLVKRAVGSVLAQTLKEIELWIVDDGSTDDTPRVVDELARSDDRVHVIHQANAGAYMARLAGIERITAEYFTSVDADDYIEPQTLSAMYDFARRHDLDVVETDLTMNHVPGETEVYQTLDEVRAKVVLPMIVRGVGYACVCGKIYRTELYRRLKTSCEVIKQRLTLFEDLLFNVQIMHLVESYGRIHEPMYHYELSDASSTRNFSPNALPGFACAVAARKRFAHLYGVAPHDVRMCEWVLKNARNLAVIAFRARGTLSFRMKNVLRVISTTVSAW